MDEIDGIDSDSSGKVSQVRRRFNRIAPDFDRAVIAAQFSSSQIALIQQARELAWTKASLDRSDDAYPFKLNLSAIARQLRFARAWLSDQQSSLVTYRVFLPRPDGRFDLNKDYRKWVDAQGRPRLDRETVEWCREVLSLWKEGDALSGKPDRKVSGKPDRKVSGKPDRCTSGVSGKPDRGCQENLTGGVRKNRQGVSGKPDTLSTPPQTPLIGTPASEDIETNTDSEKRGAALRTDAGAPAREKPADDCPAYPTPDNSILMVMTGGHPEDPAWAVVFWRKLWTAFRSIRVCNGWYEHQCWYPPERWEAALRETVRRGKTIETVAWLERLAGSADLKIGPDEAPVPGVLATLPAYAPRVNATTQHVANLTAAFRARAAEKRAAKAQEEANAAGQ